MAVFLFVLLVCLLLNYLHLKKNSAEILRMKNQINDLQQQNLKLSDKVQQLDEHKASAQKVSDLWQTVHSQK